MHLKARCKFQSQLSSCSVDFVKWSSQGMLRMSPDAMNALFKPTIDQITQHLSMYQTVCCVSETIFT